EYLLPTVINRAVRRGAARVQVLDPGSRWFGMTHPADRPRVEAALRQLVAAGQYPERMWD
ncbi:MAG: nucleotidyltransferase, partial [Gemmatimonadales bacterium]